MRTAAFLLAATTAALVTAPRTSRACGTLTTLKDERGTLTHLVPRQATRVRVASERVVLVPFWDAGKRRPALLARVRYELRNPSRRRVRLRLGIAELRARVRKVESGMDVGNEERSWSGRTILAVAARAGRRTLPVFSYPGVGRTLRWHDFSVDLGAKQRLRLDTTSISRLGHRYSHHDAHSPGMKSRHDLRYRLAAGRAWGSPMGAVRVLLYRGGERQQLRHFKKRRPGPKDDIAVELLQHTDTSPYCGHRMICKSANRLHLVSASGHHPSAGLETHFALAVDGDRQTQWVSRRGQAASAYLQLPTRRKGRLASLRILSGRPGPGRARPAQVTVRCVTRKRSTPLATTRLANRAGPHVIRIPKPVRCDAIRLSVASIHGGGRASVTIAEVEQRFVASGKTTRVAGLQRAPKLTRRHVGVKPRRYLGHEEAAVDQVSWSRDGTLLHYRLHLENRRPPASGVRLGVVLQVATGRVVQTYRLDRLGKLPAPYAQLWKRAVAFERGAAYLRKHGFTPGHAGRRPPRASVVPGQRLTLRGRAHGRLGRYTIKRTKRGFRWHFVPGFGSRRKATPSRLTLGYRARKRKARRLAQHSLAFDLGFARHHAKRWWARRRFFAALVTEWKSSSKAAVVRRTSALWHQRTYRYSQAYSGDVHVYWHPRGKSVAAFWFDRTGHSGRQPIPKPKKGSLYKWIPSCTEMKVGVCWWERRDEPRYRVGLSLRAL